MQYPQVNYSMMPQLQQPQNNLSVIQPQQPQQDPRMAQIGNAMGLLGQMDGWGGAQQAPAGPGGAQGATMVPSLDAAKQRLMQQQMGGLGVGM